MKQRIEVAFGDRTYTLDVEDFLSIQRTMSKYNDKLEHVSIEMLCSSVEQKKTNSDFMEDAQALAKQYGLKITKLEVE